MTWARRFEAFRTRKTSEATHADIRPLTTASTSLAAGAFTPIGNHWTSRLYDGSFLLPAAPDDLPALTLVFVQSKSRNTAADQPSSLGGGDTDRHLIYEGLSRVAADAVRAGAKTAAGDATFFSVWHPSLVALRQSLGLPRHPIQIVVSPQGQIDVDHTLLFNVPDAPVIVLAGPEGLRKSRRWRLRRPWLRVRPLEADWRGAFRRLRGDDGITRISVVGGRMTASALIDAGLVQDIVLTTTSTDAGEKDSPFYTGRQPLQFTAITEKHGLGSGGPIRVEHLALTSPASAAPEPAGGDPAGRARYRSRRP